MLKLIGKLYEEHGRWQDYVAWQGLLKCIGTEETHRLKAKFAAETRRRNGFDPTSNLPKKYWEGKKRPDMKGNKFAVGNTNWKGKKRPDFNGNKYAALPWITNGIVNKKLKSNMTIPEGFYFGRTDHHMQGNRYGAGSKGHRWITDGVSNRKLRPEMPMPNGWSFGKVHRKTD